MRANTKKRKKATVMLKATQEQEWWADQVVQVMLHGKRALDAAMLDVGRLVAETLMYMEREERSGPDYHPTSSGLMKWASQRGSIYVGDQKLCVEHPRLRGLEGEVVLRTYEQLKNRGGFSEELLSKVLRGMSSRKYEETVTEAGKAFGVTPSSVSRHLVEATAKVLLALAQGRDWGPTPKSRCSVDFATTHQLMAVLEPPPSSSPPNYSPWPLWPRMIRF